MCVFCSEPITDHILTSSAWDCSFVSDIDGYIGQVQIVPGWNEKMLMMIQ